MNPDEWETIRYACADADYTIRLYNKFNAWFDRYLPRHHWIIEAIESPAAMYVGMMKCNGILMDKPFMASKKTLCEENITAYREKIDTITNGVEVGYNAGTVTS